jgi:hypothetical protein
MASSSFWRTGYEDGKLVREAEVKEEIGCQSRRRQLGGQEWAGIKNGQNHPVWRRDNAILLLAYR